MGNLYLISFRGLYTDDFEKQGEWTRIEIQKGKYTSIIYTRDELGAKLNQNFITIKTIANKEITIGTKFIIEIDTINIKYDENGEFGDRNWTDRTWKAEW